MGAMGGVWLRDRHQLFARHHALPFSVRCFSRSSTRIYHHPLSGIDSAINVTLAMRILAGKLIRHCLDFDCREVLPETAVRGGENLVDLVGIEPTTSSMPWKRAPSCATGPRSISMISILTY